MPEKPDYPLHRLIEKRRKALGLSRAEVLIRMGYRNVNKGMRRLEAIAQGDLADTGFFHAPLARALEVEPEVVEEAFQATKDQRSEDWWSVYRSSFRPHLVWVTTPRRGDWQRLAALFGGYKWMREFFDPDCSPSTFLDQAKEFVGRSSTVPGYGDIKGFVINFSPDEAVRYDLEGNVMECLPRAALVGEFSVWVKEECDECSERRSYQVQVRGAGSEP